MHIAIDWSIARHLALSALLSGLIGFERGWSKKPAGLRTHLLVSLGSTLIMLISIHMAEMFPRANVDPTRIAANVVAGLGFLGAGTIMRLGVSVQGLTTAASIWAVGAIGLAVGCNYYGAAVQTTIAVLAALILFGRVEHYVMAKVRHESTGRKSGKKRQR